MKYKFRAKKICDAEWIYGYYYKDTTGHVIVDSDGLHWLVEEGTVDFYGS